MTTSKNCETRRNEVTTIPSDYLNLNQSPEELHKIHGEKDYYCYLRSPQFIEGVVKPLAEVVNSLGDSCLDIGCGDACLADYVNVPYFGIDGSISAILRASDRITKKNLAKKGNTFVFYGRIEELTDKVHRDIRTLVFCGIMEVLIKPDMRVQLVREYAKRFNSKYVVICDLRRLDMTSFDKEFGSPIIVKHLTCEPMGTDADDVKCFRKLLVYEI